MPTTDQMTKTAQGKWPVYEIEIENSGYTPNYTFATENTFVDSDISVRAHANSAGTLSLNLTDLTTAIDMGSPSGGYYSPILSLSGNLNVASAGWITSGNKPVTDNSVGVGKVAQSTLSKDGTSINSGATITPGANAQIITISAGYNAARTLTIAAASSSTAATIKSGTATLGTLTYAYDTTNNIFNISGTASISQATAESAGYISNSIGTRQTNSNTVTQTVGVIEVGSEMSGTFTKAKPIIERTAKSSGSWVDAGTGNATDTPTANKPYVQVDVAAVTATLKTCGKVTGNGYGTTEIYDKAADASYDVGSQAADTAYIAIKEATIKSPNTTASFSGPTYQSSGTNAGKFTITASGTIAKPTVSVEGYVNNNDTIGTRQTGSISGTKVLNKITVGTTISGGASGAVTPVISRTTKPSGDTWTDAASGSATDTKPTTGPYVQVDAPAIPSTISVQGKVTSAGYGTADSGSTQGTYTKATAQDITAGSTAAVTKYVPITVASGFSLSVANSTGISGTSDVTVGSTKDANNKYTITASNLSVTGTFSASTNGWFSSGSATDSDVDSCTVGKIPEATFSKSGATVSCATSGYVKAGTLPQNGTISNGTISAVASDPGSTYTNKTDIIIPSGGWLKLTAGYYGNTRISLATLVPDSATLVVVSGKSKWLHPNYTAYDNDGSLIAGDMDIYDGTIEID